MSTGTGNQCSDNACLSFKLEDDFPPSMPLPTYPKAGDVMLTTAPVFTWTPSYDTSGVKAYVFEIAEDAAFQTPVQDAVVIDVTNAVTQANYIFSRQPYPKQNLLLACNSQR